MKTKTLKNILVSVLTLISIPATAKTNSFTWSDYKQASIAHEAKTKEKMPIEEYVQQKFGPTAQRESIQQIKERKMQRGMSLSLQYSIHPEYTITTENPAYALAAVTCAADPTSPKCSTEQNITETNQTSGISFALEAPMNFVPLGVTTSGISGKMVLGSEGIDVLAYKRMVGEVDSSYSLDIGTGVKTVIADTEVFNKGFYGLASTKVNAYLEDYNLQAGFDMLFTRPKVYPEGTSRISPFFSAGIEF